jgi:hypothetical protein
MQFNYNCYNLAPNTWYEIYNRDSIKNFIHGHVLPLKIVGSDLEEGPCREASCWGGRTHC